MRKRRKNYKIGNKVRLKRHNTTERYQIIEIFASTILIGYANTTTQFGDGWNYTFDEFDNLFEIYIPYNSIWCELNV